MGLESFKPIDVNASQQLPFFEETLIAYKQAFAGYPWFEELSYEEVEKRIKNSFETKGFEGVWLTDTKKNKLAAVTWWTTPDLEQLKKERGAEFVSFVEYKLIEYNNNIQIVWINETLVTPNYQKMGVATHLKTIAESRLQDKANLLKTSLLITTRMRDDNFGIIKINEGLGMQRTGVRVPASQKPGMFHEFWFKMIQPRP